ncbi:hypothetical protein GRZ55_10970 [Chelativorans sp. ZYF759]|uniref:hypothetical protein n=1 Tax=Chelativorans sp. ZYF759 TaxID=2692213 RepID=UPI00145F3F78|nr:hypothetical protein [Chelativorans sp. ZYF759]NMG39764.1 hypothetical protein [Chelativorans sp. ZYF759]
MASKEPTSARPKEPPTHGVFVVEGDGKDAFWTRIGGAWAHRDGQGFNLTLAALPLSGRLVVRANKGGEQ